MDKGNEFERAAKLNAIIAEIGRIIGASTDIHEVYKHFSEKVKELISFDRISVSLVHADQNTHTIPFVDGISIPGKQPEDTVPLAGTLTERVFQTRKGQLIHMNDESEVRNKFSGLLTEYRSGIRSFLSVPLFSRDCVIGVLHLRSITPQLYQESDLEIAEGIANQIAGAIANSILLEETRRLVQENAIVAEIGRIISSTFNIDEVYERFAQEVRRLIPFDRISINTIRYENDTVMTAYSTGTSVAHRVKGKAFLLTGTATEEVMQTHTGLLIQAEDRETLGSRFPGLLSSYDAGIRSMMTFPLISTDRTIGSIFLGSSQPNAYTGRDLKLAGIIASQIAGAIANAQLFLERTKAEEEKTSLEEQLHQSQKMEAIGRLAGGIAHDFNNLLTVIRGYCQLSLSVTREYDPIQGNLQEIERATERATDLTRQLLAFSRRQVLDLKVLDLNTVLKDLDKMLRRILGEDIELVTLLSSSLGKIKTDPGKIEQVILNLAVNARDAMPQGGKLILETENVVLDEGYIRTHVGVRPGSYVRLSVSDTGVGMSPLVMNHLFEPFFTTKEKGKGTGLGLSTVYGIIKQSGGNIWVYSEQGTGTTFKIHLPVAGGEVEAFIPRADEQAFPVGHETILLVEDEPSLLNLVAQVLRGQGYIVIEAVNGEEALRIMREPGSPHIDLLLTDVVMPRMGGKDLADRLRALRPTAKVLYTSGYTDNTVVLSEILEPGIAFLQKPYSLGVFTRKVREILDLEN